MHTLICGSLAYDTIMVFPDRFRHHILPEKIHMLSVAFLVPELRREWGGTAGNIAYTLKLLGGDPRIMATVGEDFGPYAERLDRLGISRANIKVISGTYTAQAFITTDLDDNQITAFHPGAMNHSHENKLAEATQPAYAVIAPDGKAGMLQHAEECRQAGIPYLFDPGQGLPMLSKEDILHFLDGAHALAVNDYEAELIFEKTGLDLKALSERVQLTVVTRGAEGSSLMTQQAVHDIPAVTPEAVLDPTGCGDAYRGGLLFGLSQGWPIEKTGRLASLMGAIKIASKGGQNHQLTRAQIEERYEAAFKEALF